MKLLKPALFFLFFTLLVSCNNDNPILINSYTGSWKCTEERSLSTKQIYVVHIEYNKNDSNTFLIRNFFNNGENSLFIVRKNSDNNFSIVEQPSNGEILKNISGIAVPYSSITFNFIVFDGEKDITCKTTLVRN